MIRVEKITGTKKIKDFIDFPHELHKNDKNYVPELYLAQKDLLDPKKHPFFEHSSLDLFLAYKDGKVAGRIAAIKNNNHIKASGNNEGFFGFFDVINDYEVARKLFDTACDWVKQQGMNAILGPANFSTNETAGWLVRGNDMPPAIMMTYNQPYYVEFAEKYGMEKKMEMLSYEIRTETVSEKALKLADAFETRLKAKGITIRTMDLKRYDQEAENAHAVYNIAWDDNWGFVPMTRNEFMHLAKDLKQIIDPNLVFVAEKDGKMIGFSISIPDLNQILINVKRGRLLPTGIFKLIFGQKKITNMRVVILGVIDGYRKLGIEAIFYAKTIANGRARGMTTAEAGWILENNEMMNAGLVNINAQPFKAFRMYGKNL
ncbi:MAG: hypothetical protein ACXVPQ_09475 [Bacteroidia bacterium]